MSDTSTDGSKSTTPLATVVTSADPGVKVYNNVGHLLAIATPLVAIVIAICGTVLALNQRITGSDAVSLYVACLAGTGGIAGIQSVKKSG